MRYLCVLLIVVGLPLSAGAQQRRQPPPPPQPPPPIGMGVIGLPLASMGLPPTINQRQWTLPTPAWERPQLPSWERPRPPAWEGGLHPSQPIQPGFGYRPYLGPAVVYVMQPYPIYEPYPVVVAAPPPEPPPTLLVEEERAAPPPAPLVLPTGSRTMYVIPGCYLGNVPPDQDRLPAGCDISRMKTHAPQ
jgi:hypothetical protein